MEILSKQALVPAFLNEGLFVGECGEEIAADFPRSSRENMPSVGLCYEQRAKLNLMFQVHRSKPSHYNFNHTFSLFVFFMDAFAITVRIGQLFPLELVVFHFCSKSFIRFPPHFLYYLPFSISNILVNDLLIVHFSVCMSHLSSLHAYSHAPKKCSIKYI